jgi:hypothetical protein
LYLFLHTPFSCTTPKMHKSIVLSNTLKGILYILKVSSGRNASVSMRSWLKGRVLYTGEEDIWWKLRHFALKADKYSIQTKVGYTLTWLSKNYGKVRKLQEYALMKVLEKESLWFTIDHVLVSFKVHKSGSAIATTMNFFPSLQIRNWIYILYVKTICFSFRKNRQTIIKAIPNSERAASL